MACVVCKITFCLLFLAAVRSSGVQSKQIVYVDEGNETLGPSSWENGPGSQSESVKVALDSTELDNSTIVVVKPKCKNVTALDDRDTPCPTWFLPDPLANGTCRCGNDIDGAISCNESTKEVAILDCYCMTYNESTGPVVGTCLYNCIHPKLEDTLYHPLPSSITELDVWVFQPSRTALWKL